MFRNVAQIPHHYEEIALLNATGDANFADEPRLIDAMRKKAGALGANGLLLDGFREPSTVEQVTAAVFRTESMRRGRAIAIDLFPDSATRER